MIYACSQYNMVLSSEKYFPKEKSFNVCILTACYCCKYSINIFYMD